MSIKKKKPLVSIITPCYNGEKFVRVFMDSVLNQTYPNLELIFINDGSTDKTEEVVLSYENKLKIKGIDLKYIYQENKGQAAAINQGLKIFKGEYLTWPDSDDILHENNIYERVKFLEENKNYNVVLCESIFINNNREEIGRLKRTPQTNDDNIFSDLILENNAIFAGGAYMFRATTFVEALPDRSIYESRGGQNWQIILPVLYNNKCAYIKKGLYYIYIREGSHSRELKDFKDYFERCNEHEDLLINTISRINNMPQQEKEYWHKVINSKYLKKRLRIASQYRIKDILDELYLEVKNKKIDTFNDKIVYYSGKYLILSYIQKFSRFPLIILRKIKGKLYDR